MIRRLFGLHEERAIDPGTLWAQGVDLVGGSTTVAGKHVTADTALQVSAVWGCLRILTDAVASLPLDAQRLTEQTKSDGSLLKVVTPERPTPPWLRFDAGPQRKTVFLTQVMMSLLLEGNAYIATYRNGTGSVLALEVLDPAVCEPERVGNEVLVRVNGTITSPLDVLHVPGLMKPGTVKGLSPISYARESVALAITATEFGSSFFVNGAFPGGLVEYPGQMTKEGISLLKEQWNELHRGTGNAHKIGVLTEGAAFKRIAVDATDAQFLETRAFQVSDIARIYGVPPHLLADASNSTSWGSGLAEQNQAFLQQSLKPWVHRIEEGLTWLLWSEGRPRWVSAAFDPSSLLRAGSFEERISAYASAVQAGLLTPDEAREELGRPPHPGGVGSVPLAQLNLTTLEKLDEEEPEPQPVPPALAAAAQQPPPPPVEEDEDGDTPTEEEEA